MLRSVFGLADLLLGAFHQSFAGSGFPDGIGNSANKLGSGADAAVRIDKHHRDPGLAELVKGLLRADAAVGNDDRRLQTCDCLNVKNVPVFRNYGTVVQLLLGG